MLSSDQRALLGEFIRAHRERAAPPPSTGRRRTPGLRRDELAALAGISSTWCTWLEQGREVQASPEALGRIADALALSPAERAYLFKLAGRLDPDEPRPAALEAPLSLRAAVETSVFPAYGLDRLWNACCWNAAAANLFRGWLDGERQRNLLRFVFLEAAARDLLPDWEVRARRILAEFRTDYARSFRDARVRELVSALRAESAIFAKAWDEQDVRDRSGGERVFNHPAEGRRAFAQHTYFPSDRPDYKLVFLVPAKPGKALSTN